MENQLSSTEMLNGTWLDNITEVQKKHPSSGPSVTKNSSMEQNCVNASSCFSVSHRK